MRRQPEGIVSGYNTFVYAEALPLNILDYSNNPLGCTFLGYHEYSRIVERWSVFEKDKIKIRTFDKQDLHGNDLLSDFAHTVGFNMEGLVSSQDANISMNSAETEFLRLLNLHFPKFVDQWTGNPDRRLVQIFFNKCKEGRVKETNDKWAYYLNRNEAQQILDRYREGNDWIAREYLGRKKLFSEDVSMYPEEVVPHQLTLERSVEISAQLLKFHATEIQQQQTQIKKRDAEIQRLQVEIKNRDTEIQHLWTEIQNRDVEVQRQQTEVQRLLHRRKKRLLYRFKVLLTWIKQNPIRKIVNWGGRNR